MSAFVLEGPAASLLPSTRALLGLYEERGSAPGMNVHERIWQHVRWPEERLAHARHSWFVQSEQDLGQAQGWLRRATGTAGPCAAESHALWWERQSSGVWLQLDTTQLHCRELSEAEHQSMRRDAEETLAASRRPLLLAEHAVEAQEGERREPPLPPKLLGLYELLSTPGRQPTWQHSRWSDRFLAFEGRAWYVQSERHRGQPLGWLTLRSEALPTQRVGGWRWRVGGAWVSRPRLHALALGEAEHTAQQQLDKEEARLEAEAARRAVLLDAGDDTQVPRSLLGLYERVDKRLVNQQPVWCRQRHGVTKWLAFSGKSWYIQRDELLGKGRGWLQLRDAALPSRSNATWMWHSIGAWRPLPTLRAHIATDSHRDFLRDMEALVEGAEVKASAAASKAWAEVGGVPRNSTMHS